MIRQDENLTKRRYCSDRKPIGVAGQDEAMREFVRRHQLRPTSIVFQGAIECIERCTLAVTRKKVGRRADPFL